MSSLTFLSPLHLYRSSFLNTSVTQRPYSTSHLQCQKLEQKYASIILSSMSSNGNDTKPPVEVPPELQSLRVVGLGMAGIDMLARVVQFPKPDEKIRTTSTDIRGGGNTANTLTAIRRLGLNCSIVSKVGKDVYGDLALRELQEDGIDTTKIIQKQNVNTSFSYVIVDTTNDTRTCIATASQEDILVTEIDESMLQNASMLILDGRHTLAAIQLAKYAKKNSIPILVDVERDRPYIGELLPYADYIVTNSKYPFVFAPDASDCEDALSIMLERCDAKFVISTLGRSGSLLLQPKNDRERGSGLDLFVQTKPYVSRHSSKNYEIVECPSWPVCEIVDTTGAGDAFIGGIVYGIICKMETERMLSLASYVAAKKIEAKGSRDGLPRRENIPFKLLLTLPSLKM